MLSVFNDEAEYLKKKKKKRNVFTFTSESGWCQQWPFHEAKIKGFIFVPWTVSAFLPICPNRCSWVLTSSTQPVKAQLITSWPIYRLWGGVISPHPGTLSFTVCSPLSISLFLSPIYLSIYLSLPLSIYLSIYLRSIYLSIYQSI